MNKTVEKFLYCVLFAIGAVLVAFVYGGVAAIFLRAWSWKTFWIVAVVVFVILVVWDALMMRGDEGEYYAKIEDR